MGRFEHLEFVPGLNIYGITGPEIWPGSFWKLHPTIQKKNKKLDVNDSQHDFRYCPAHKCFFVWAGCWDSAEIDPRRKYTGTVQYMAIQPWWGCMYVSLSNMHQCKMMSACERICALPTLFPHLGWIAARPQTGWIGPIGPPRKIGNKYTFVWFFQSMKKMPGMAPNGAGRILSY